MCDCCLEGIEPCKDINGWVIRSLDKLKKKRRRRRSEISGRDLQKPLGEFKTVNSLQNDKC
jgi:hypothetical protein